MKLFACTLLLLSAALCALSGVAEGTTQRISEQKCQEFLERVSRPLTFLPLTAEGTPVVVKVSDCEVNNVQLIVGGEEAKLGEFPYMAALGYGEGEPEWKCGGSLISERYVLTAAHCIGQDRPRVVRLGEHDLSTSDDGASPVDYRVQSVIVHPDYSPPSKYNDLALIRLANDVRFTQKIRPACLNTESPYGGSMVIASGWGKVGFTESQSPKLLKVAFPIVREQVCTDLWANTIKVSPATLPRGIDHEIMICAGQLDGEKDTCLGDSGGPLTVRSVNNTCISYVVGITSFGRYCGFRNSPGIYTRVASFLPWIERIVWGAR
ncbi:venom protease-like [Cloeon dipterum]|uniref:venom protease-like n=1 Tax=Cloeon dipterum TaxID=197152 RepID=UPI00322087FD